MVGGEDGRGESLMLSQSLLVRESGLGGEGGVSTWVGFTRFLTLK